MKAAEMFKVEGYGAIVTGGASGLGCVSSKCLPRMARASPCSISILPASTGRSAASKS